MRAPSDAGWSWFAEPKGQEGGDEASTEVARAFARCFAGPEGERALTYLRALTLDRYLGPNASDAALRHIEGQRHLVAHVTALIDRGRRP